MMASWGLSPRGRGNLGLVVALEVRQRSIPAWAGEPMLTTFASGREWVYPRVGGGTVDYYYWMGAGQGLSPRGRGNLEIGTGSA